MAEVGSRIVIVGAGFGGLAAAKALSGSGARVTLIDRSNHHLFQPLLYQVATAALSPADIAVATRAIVGQGSGVSVVMDEVTGVDVSARAVRTSTGKSYAYDQLILATGADYNFFGNDEWARHAAVLKTMDDALSIRERLLAAFEQAEQTQDGAARSHLLTFVVVGGGPTGVEMAGSIAEMARTSLASDYRTIRAEDIRILLVEAGDRILSAFGPEQSARALDALARLGVEVKLSSPVQAVDATGATVAGERIASASMIWCAGTRARDAAAWLGVEAERGNTVSVKADCSVPGHPDVFVIGDGASYLGEDGRALPGLAPVAKQQGRYVGRLLRRRLAGKPDLPPFRYRNWGTMAVIGRSHAIADFGWLRLSGYPAWLTWSLVHLMLLVDFRSRASVYLSWSWAWFTRGRAARLLTRKRLPVAIVPPLEPTSGPALHSS